MSGNRRWRRVVVNWPAVLIRGDMRGGCTIVDISNGGAKVQAANSFGSDGEISLVGPSFGVIEGQIIWRKGEYVGLRFSQAPYQIQQRLEPLLAGSRPRKEPERAQRPIFGRRK